jgi:putative oxidoreductase
MIDDARPTSLGVTLLRFGLGIMFLAHSIVLKLMTFGLPGTAAFFRSVGLPGWLGYATFFAEAVGGVLLVLGVQTRWVALALSPFLLGAIATVHLKNGWLFEAPGGGWEYPAYLFLLCITQALLGDGMWAASPSLTPRSLLRRAAPGNLGH